MKWLLAFLVLILFGLQTRLWVGEGSLAHLHRLEGEIAKQQEENKRLKAKNALLAAEVAALKNGLDAIEARAREDMGMIKKGETFFLIVDDEEEN